jgi:DNA-binding response OmpR family regulator
MKTHCPWCGSNISTAGLLFSATDAYYDGQPLKLSKAEYEVLKKLWDEDQVHATSNVICRIRVKLRDASVPFVIRPVEGEGYVLQPLVPGVNDWAVKPGYGRSSNRNASGQFVARKVR